MNPFDKKSLLELLARYIRLHYRQPGDDTPLPRPDEEGTLQSLKTFPFMQRKASDELEALDDLVELDEDLTPDALQVPKLPKKSASFQEVLFKLLDEKFEDEVEVYQRSGLSRTHFSKIRSEVDYQPTKATVFKLAIGMRLNLEEAIVLLASAGFSFKMSSYTDLIVRWALQNRQYKTQLIDECLVSYQQLPLFSSK
jgi:hypothetical protein